MLEFARWKYLLVAAVALVALLFAAPNFFGEDLALQVARQPEQYGADARPRHVAQGTPPEARCGARGQGA